MRVWVTRAEPEAQRTAQALIAAGHTPLVEPLLQVQILAGAEAALAGAIAGAGALAFTSLSAVRAFAQLQPARDWPVFAVGAATAAAARAAGFAEVMSADGDVTALAALIAAHPPGGPVLHPRALEPAGDLVGDLAARGLYALDVAIYDTAPREPSPAFLDGIDQDVDAVMIHSGKAAAVLAPSLGARPALAARLILCAISAPAAQPLERIAFARRAVAPSPNEPAMLAVLSR